MENVFNSIQKLIKIPINTKIQFHNLEEYMNTNLKATPLTVVQITLK